LIGAQRADREINAKSTTSKVQREKQDRHTTSRNKFTCEKFLRLKITRKKNGDPRIAVFVQRVRITSWLRPELVQPGRQEQQRRLSVHRLGRALVRLQEQQQGQARVQQIFWLLPFDRKRPRPRPRWRRGAGTCS
jgi:hypothetical protein